MRRRWAAVVFDLDGVLIDSEPIFLEAARRLLAEREIALDLAFMQQVMGMPGREVLPLFRERFQLEMSVHDLGVEYKRHFFESMPPTGMPLRPGVLEIMDRVRALDHRVGLATSSQREYVDRILAPFGFLKHFDHVVTCDDVTQGKPAPDIYHLAARRFQSTPDRLLVIEDSPNGVQAAKSAGCFCVAVPPVHIDKKRVASADVIAASLTDELMWQLL